MENLRFLNILHILVILVEMKNVNRTEREAIKPRFLLYWRMLSGNASWGNSAIDVTFLIEPSDPFTSDDPFKSDPFVQFKSVSFADPFSTDPFEVTFTVQWRLHTDHVFPMYFIQIFKFLPQEKDPFGSSEIKSSVGCVFV